MLSSFEQQHEHRGREQQRPKSFLCADPTLDPSRQKMNKRLMTWLDTYERGCGLVCKLEEQVQGNKIAMTAHIGC